MKRLFRWVEGRQCTGYYVLTLARFIHSPIPFDFYLLKYPVGAYIPLHKDEPGFGRHYRVNIILKKAKKGGIFWADNTIYSNNRINFFRPDLSSHLVSKVENGTRYVLSFGWILK